MTDSRYSTGSEELPPYEVRALQIIRLATEQAEEIRALSRPVAAAQEAASCGVTDAMVDTAMERFQAAVNSMVMCPRCNGVGHHHGFGEDGHDPDWCEKCGGCQSTNEFEDKEAMREALKAALGIRDLAYSAGKCGEVQKIAADAIRTFCQSLGSAAVQMSHGQERIYYSGISLDALSVAVALALTSTSRATPEPGNRFCKHDDCPYPDCLVEGGVCPSQPASQVTSTHQKTGEA